MISIRAKKLHEKAQELTRTYRKTESHLVEVLSLVDKHRTFVEYGFNSLYAYAIHLGLSESQSYDLINVARKSREIPELKKAVLAGTLSVSKARRIVPVITRANQADWIDLASQMTSRQIERAVVETKPQTQEINRIRPSSKGRAQLQWGISTEIVAKLEWYLDYESQRQQENVDFEKGLEALLDEHFELHDPIQKAKRSKSLGTGRVVPKEKPKKGTKKISGIPARIKHQIALRDQRKCQFPNCGATRWLELHHIIPLSQGGPTTIENLITLCKAHHRHVHNYHKVGIHSSLLKTDALKTYRRQGMPTAEVPAATLSGFA